MLQKTPSKEFYQKNRERCINYQRDFYENNKEVIKERARVKYHNLSFEEKDKRSEYAKNWYNNLSEDKKNIKREYGKSRYHNMNDEQMQKHKDYQKNYQKMYCEKKKQELQNIKKEQGNIDQNAVLTPPKTQQSQEPIKILCLFY